MSRDMNSFQMLRQLRWPLLLAHDNFDEREDNNTAHDLDDAVGAADDDDDDDGEKST